MQITKYYCDKCGEEGRILDEDELKIINPLHTVGIQFIQTNEYNDYKFINIKEMYLCEKCEEKYMQLVLEMNNKWNEKISINTLFNILQNNFKI